MSQNICVTLTRSFNNRAAIPKRLLYKTVWLFIAPIVLLIHHTRICKPLSVVISLDMSKNIINNIIFYTYVRTDLSASNEKNMEMMKQWKKNKQNNKTKRTTAKMRRHLIPPAVRFLMMMSDCKHSMPQCTVSE